MNENNQNQPYNYNDQSDNVHNNQTYNNVSQNCITQVEKRNF